ncbi:amino acid adenylation domain-containing protein [Gordonia aurantiaca]|uniref:amino acid adenylation domain-containing protein n=1 Tax=Gordonia sp. B21 TaxID=3151852 RepID=UPI003264A0FC
MTDPTSPEPHEQTDDIAAGAHRFRLNAAQRWLWYTQQAALDVPINIAQYVEIDGPIDIGLFQHVTSEVVRRAKFTQIRFEETDEGPVGVYDPSLHYWADVVDLRDRPDPMAAAEAIMREDCARPLDPRVDRTARGCLFRLADEKFLVYNRGHHLLSDGVGGKDRMVEALAAYTAAVTGAEPPPAVPVDLGLPARADDEYRASTRFATDREYWRQVMAGVGTPITLAHRRGRPEAVSRRVSGRLPDATMRALRRAAEERSTILPNVIVAAFSAYLCRAAADGDEVIFRFPVAARTTAALRSTPMPVSNVVPLRTGVVGRATVSEALATTQAALLGALRHQRYRGEDIWADTALGDSDAGRGARRTAAAERSGPMLNLMLFQREFPCGEAHGTFHVITVGPAEDMAVNIFPVAGEDRDAALMIGVEANPNRYDDAELAEHHRQFVAMLSRFAEALVDAPDTLVDDLSLDRPVPAASGAQIGRHPATVPEALAEAVARHAHFPAIECTATDGPARPPTFGEIHARAGDLAVRLHALGIWSGAAVGIALPPGEERLVAWWSVARAGAAVVLLDPDRPACESLGDLPEVARPSLVIGVPRAGDVDGTYRVMTLDDIAGAAPAPTPRRPPAPGDIACHVTTSGAAGRPRTVAVPQRALAALVVTGVFDAPNSTGVFDAPSTTGVFDAPAGDLDHGRLSFGAPAMSWAAHLEIVAAASHGLRLVPAGAPAGVAAPPTHVIATTADLLRHDGRGPETSILVVADDAPPAVVARLAFGREVTTPYVPLGTLGPFTRSRRVAPGTESDSRIPCGAPAPGTALAVLDHRLRPVPAGVTGDIHVAGVLLPAGFAGDAARTATTFVACPWSPGTRMMRTGDRGHFDPATGMLVVDRRAVDLVTVGLGSGTGVQLDLAALDRAAARVPGVRHAVAVATAAGLDVAILADDGAVGPAAGEDIDPQRIRAAVRRRVDEEVPVVTRPRRVVIVDRLPCDATGTVDRARVAEMIAATPELRGVHRSPVTGVEKVVAEAVTDVLGVPDPSMDDELVQLGATSLGVMQLATLLGTRLRVVVDVAGLLAATTLADIAAVVEQAAPRRTTTGDGTVTFRPTRVQQEIWLLNRADPRATVYHLAVRLSFVPGVGAGAIRAALIDVAERHEALRTRYPEVDGRPVARVRPRAEAAAAAPITGATLDPAGVELAVSASFDLCTEVPWRAVVDDTRDPVEMVLVAHHITVDEWSLHIVLADFAHAVAARSAGREPAWDTEAVAFSAVLEDRGPHEAPDSPGAQVFWTKYLRDTPERLALPEPARAPARTSAGALGLTAGPAVHTGRRIGRETVDAAAALARASGATLNTLLCVALAAVLSEYTDSDDIVMSMPVAGRRTSDELRPVGMFVETVPVRVTGVRARRVGDALRNVGDDLDGVVTHAPSAPTGLADVIFAYHPATPDLATAEIASGRTLRTADARTSLEFTLIDDGSGLSVTLTVAAQRVDVRAAERILDTFVTTVAELGTSDPDRRVVEALPAGRIHEPPARTTALIDPVEALVAHALRRPDAPAVVSDGARLTRGELVHRARSFAGELHRCGVRPGDRVALLMGRGLDTVVAIVAALMADAVYVPIDPDLPQKRREVILDGTAPAVIVRDGPEISPGPGLRRAQPMPGAAYVIHTSGSTGVPKAVVVSRENLAALLGAGFDIVGATERDVWAWTHSYAFDFSVWEILGALASGGTVAVVDLPTIRDPWAMAAAVERRGITLLCQTPTAFAGLAAVTTRSELSSLRTVIFGGESLAAEALRTWACEHPNTRLINMYGVTETTVVLTATDVDLDDDRSVIGTAFDGVGWMILDRELRPVPTGAAGELYLLGEQVALGYLAAPGLTAARFVADPSGGGRRMYRTGDRVREVAPGTLEYLGRNDDQIQIRGFRVELGEIVSVLRSVPGVGDARVLVRPGRQPGDEQLLAFVTEDGLADFDVLDALDEPSILAVCTEHLPRHEIPSRVTIVDGWPMTRTGKIDRDKLFDQVAGATPAPARTLDPLEETVASAMRTVIGDDVGVMGPDTNFFAAGGTSLSAARLAATLEGMGHRVEVADVFAHPTVAGLAARIVRPGRDTLSAGTSKGRHPPLLADDRALPADLPLTPEQMDVWLRWRTQPEFSGYLLPIALPVDATADEIRKALSGIVTRHDALCTVFPTRDREPVLERLGDDEVLAHLERELGGRIAERAERLPNALAALMTPIDLATTLPWRVRIAEIDGRNWILGVIHHIAADGESFAILAHEFRAALTGSLPEHTGVDYRRYALWRTEVLERRRGELAAYWRTAFSRPVEPLRLREVNLQAGHGASSSATVLRARATLDPGTTAALDDLTVGRRSTPFVAVHTVLAAVLARQSGAEIVTIGTALSGRLDPAVIRVPGLFARAVPLHTPVDVDATFDQLMARVTQVDLGAFAHADLPLNEIAEIADPGRAGAGTPLFEVSFGVVPDAIADRFPGFAALGVPLFGIDVSMHRQGGALHVTMTCTDAVADADRLNALCDLVVETLRRAVAAPERTIAELTAPVDDTVAEPGHAPETFADLLTTGLADHPSRTAVVDHRHIIPGFGPELSNADLDRATTCLARVLIARGIGAGDVVVAALPRSVFGVVAAGAIARAGAAFVNVDPADPDERRRDIIRRCRPVAVLTIAGAPEPGAAGIPVIAVDEVFAGWATGAERETPDRARFDGAPFDSAERVRPVRLDDVAYLTFTSGTTGVPKGVQVTHRGLAGWARDTAERLRLTEYDRVLHTYATGFDAHLMGVLPPRIAGATIIICPPDVIAGDDLADLMRHQAVTVLLTTPSVLPTLRPEEVPGVRHVAVGGEPLGAAAVREWTRTGTLSNEYGPTEATVAVCSARYIDAPAGPVHIGYALDGVTMHVLDERLRPVPDHTVGELYLAGNCLARGYLDDPGATATAFLPDIAGTGGRMYRTGDLVHRRPDGTFVIHGRTDDQVKVRGVRLEPAEIDAALSTAPGVAASVTDTRTTAAGEKILVSWVVAEPGAEVGSATLAGHLAQRLPRPMVPAAFVRVDALPIGRNGKIDVAALPEPAFAGAGAAETDGRALTGTTEELVARVFAEILDRPVSALDAASDFFAEGGTSLSATQVTSRVASATGAGIGVRSLFDARTVREFARRVDEAVDAASSAALPVPARLPVPDLLPLAYPQRRMWIHHHFDPTSTAYHVPVVLRVSGRVDVARLRKAVDEVVGAHAVLRTVYPDTGGGPVQRRIERRSPVLSHELVRVDAAGDAETILRQRITEYLREPFDLEAEPGFRAAVFEPVASGAATRDDRPADTDLYLAAVLHHIAVDGWSIRVLLDDLVRAYDGERLSTAADEAFTYADFTQWQIARLGDPADPASLYARQIRYWTAVLADAGDPVRFPGRRDDAIGAGSGRLTATVADTEALHTIAQRSSATVFQVAHAALAATIGRVTGRWDAVVGVPVHGRTAVEWESVVGMFVNTVALRTRLDPAAPVGDAVEHVRETALAALAHGDVPYEDVARAVRPDAHDGDDPLISVLLVSQDVVPHLAGAVTLWGPSTGDAGPPEPATARVIDDMVETVDAKYDIEVVLAESDHDLRITLVHSARIPRAVASGFLDAYTDVLTGITDAAQPFPAVTADLGQIPAVTADLGQPDRAGETDDQTTASAAARGAGADTAGLVGRIAAIMAEVLELPGTAPSASGDFFSLGGTSLSATRVTSALGRSLGVRVPTRLLFENPTPEALAAAVATLIAQRAVTENTETAAESAPTGTGGGVSDVPLAPTQRRMWVAAQLLGPVPIYSVPVVVPVAPGSTDDEVVAAVERIVDRHPALRTRYPATPDGPRQRVVAGWHPEIRRVTTGDLEDLAAADFATPFDLSGEPPVRVWLVSDGVPVGGVPADDVPAGGASVGGTPEDAAPMTAAPVAVVLVAHHIAMDGESAAIVESELAALLRGEVLDEAPVGFDVLARRMLADEQATRADLLDHWRRTLDGYSGELDLASRRPAVRDLRTSMIEIGVGDELSEQISEAARRSRASGFHILHAATALALAAQTGIDDIAVATPASMRRDNDSARTVGMLTSTVVLRTRLTTATTLGELIEQVRDADLEALDHAAIAFDDVVALVDPPRVPGRHPLVQVAFSVIDATVPTAALAGPPAANPNAAQAVPDSHSEFDVHIVAVRSGDGWRLRLYHARDLFDDHVIHELGERLTAALVAVVDTPERRVAGVEPLTVAEREFVGLRARSAPPTGNEPLLADLLAEAVQAHGDRPAITDGDRTLTYREFDAWVSVTARALRDRGIGAGDAVAVVIPRSIESVVAVWAVSRLGGTCVPVDVTYPIARIDQVTAGAGATPIRPSDIPARPAGPVASEPVARVSPDSLAYVITTSGTTGTPNIVGVPHRGVHRVAALGDVRSDDRVGMAISPGFDATFHDMLLPLATGATLVVVPAEIVGGNDLAGFLDRTRVSVFTATPSVMRTMRPGTIRTLRLVYIGGEALTADLAEAWSAHARVMNIYGPTETTVTVSTSAVRPGEPIRLGSPRPGIGVEILDARLRHVPPGVVGELYVSGTGVARCYLGDPALTAASFVAAPDGRRRYRTGDLVRWDRDTGELVYVGRADRQIKIRGQRVEPAEIDAVLVRAGADRAITVLRDGPAGPALVSYVVSQAPAEDLLAVCRATLPRHMVPSRVVELDDLPLSGAGKIDRGRLPEPQWSSSTRQPENVTQATVRDAFRAVLRRHDDDVSGGAQVGMDDDFFALGGNSLALVALRDEVSTRTGVRVEVAELFAHRTPAEVADLLEARASGAPISDLRVVPLSRHPRVGERERIVWCVHTAAGVVEPFRPFAEALPGVTVLGLQLPELVLAGRELPSTLAEIAALHVESIRQRQSDGPYHLVGWSLGGNLAHEIARQLVDAGAEVATLLILDSRAPDELRDVPDDELLGDDHPLRDLARRYDPDALRRFEERTRTLAHAVRSHDLGAVDAGVGVGRVVYVVAEDNPEPGRWAGAVGDSRTRVDVVSAGVTHARMGEPDVMRRLAESFETWLLEEEW